MKAKLFNKGSGCCDPLYCIDKKVHVSVGAGIEAEPCDGSCEPSEVELGICPHTEATITRALRTGLPCYWDEEESNVALAPRVVKPRRSY